MWGEPVLYPMYYCQKKKKKIVDRDSYKVYFELEKKKDKLYNVKLSMQIWFPVATLYSGDSPRLFPLNKKCYWKAFVTQHWKKTKKKTFCRSKMEFINLHFVLLCWHSNEAFQTHLDSIQGLKSSSYSQDFSIVSTAKALSYRLHYAEHTSLSFIAINYWSNCWGDNNNKATFGRRQKQ